MHHRLHRCEFLQFKQQRCQSCLCPKGDAGRHGVVGEKGPNGLPVSIQSFISFVCHILKSKIRFAGFIFLFFRVCKERPVPKDLREKL